MKRPIHYVLVAAKAVGMGAAEIVPGVSGGTIAFLTGIYEELLDSIKSVDLKAIRTLRKEGFGAFWSQINGNFLVAVFIGMLSGIFLFASGVQFMLANYPEILWAFFFGLIIASVVFVGRQVGKWNVGTVIAFIAGAGAGYAITVLSQVETPQVWWFALLAGIVAITAMILPGISGSFILVILGQYSFILGAVNRRDFLVLGSMALGCVIGLLTFSRVISYLFKTYRDLTVATLTGFILGSVNKIWPWRNVTEVYQDRHGKYKALVEENVLPGTYEDVITTAESTYLNISDKEAFLIPCLIAMVVGFVLVFGMEWLSPKQASDLQEERPLA